MYNYKEEEGEGLEGGGGRERARGNIEAYSSSQKDFKCTFG